MNIDAVLKIGGSLSRGLGLPALCGEIGLLSKRHSLVVVPGGGDFAEQVRAADRRFSLEPTAAHRMAVLAMDQYAYVLNQLIPNCCLTADLNDACEFAASGKTAILLPAAIIAKEDPLPHSWLVSSDSIAAWLSARVGCRLLILLKDVDGLLDSNGLIEGLTVQELAGRAGGVDEYLSNVLSQTRLETWIVNGLHPERLSELFATGRTRGTRIPS